MRLTKTLLGYLNRVFEKDPKAFWALRFRYAGGMTWRVLDGRLTIDVTGGPGADLDIDLSAHTLRSLADDIAGRPGFTVDYIAADRASLSAKVLLDMEGDQAASNGDRLYGYTSILWAWLEAVSLELVALRAEIPNMVDQMSVNTGSDVWLDEVGGYYNVPRLGGESDQLYGPRIIAETLRPRSNNLAIANAISTYTGQPANVLDVTTYGGNFPLYSGAITHNAAQTHSAGANPIYGLFDVEYGYDLVNAGSIAAFQAAVTGIVNRVRAAGTHLRSLALKGSSIIDVFTAPTDSSDFTAVLTVSEAFTAPTEAMEQAVFVGLADTLTAPTEDAGTEIASTFTQAHGGGRDHNGAVTYAGNYILTQPPEGTTPTLVVKLPDDLYLYIDATGETLTYDGGNLLEWPR